MTTYAEKLRDPRWQKKRLEIMERDGFVCRECGDKASTLNVHHGYYARGRSPWEYPDHHLVTLCEACHQEYEEKREEILGYLVQMPIDQQSQLADIAMGPSSKLAMLDSVGMYPAFLLHIAAEVILLADDPCDEARLVGEVLLRWRHIKGVVAAANEMFCNTSFKDEQQATPATVSAEFKESVAPTNFSGIRELTGFFPDGATDEDKTGILAELIEAKRRQQGIGDFDTKKIPVMEAVKNGR